MNRSYPTLGLSRPIPRFGWDNSPEKNPQPKSYTLELLPRDILLGDSGPIPHPSILQHIEIHLKGLDQNRFILLTGLKRLLGSEEKVHHFQESLMKGLYGTLREKQPEAFPARRYNLLCQLIKGYGPTTQMHWDFKEWPFLSISYRQTKALQNSAPLVADSTQLFHDLQKDPKGRLYLQSIPDSPDKPDKILADHRQRMDERYRIPISMDPVSDIPILIFNNQRWSGILHGAERPEGGQFEDQRTIYQIAISADTFPEHKYAKLQFHRHKKIPLAETRLVSSVSS